MQVIVIEKKQKKTLKKSYICVWFSYQVATALDSIISKTSKIPAVSNHLAADYYPRKPKFAKTSGLRQKMSRQKNLDEV